MTVSHHISDLQILGYNQAVAVDDLACLLVVEVQALVSDFPMEAGYNQFRLLSIGATLLFAGERPLYSFQLCFSFAEVLRVSYLSSIRQGGKGLQPDIDADCFGWHRSLLWFILGRETGIPVFAIFANSAGFYLSDDIPVHFDFQVADLGKFEPPVIDLETRFLWVGDAIVPALRLEAGITRLTLFLGEAAKEPLIGSLYPEQHVLQYLRMDFLEQQDPFFVGGQNLLLSDPGKAFTGCLVVILPIHQAGVIQNATDLKS